jgi:serine/threonine protein phosphatase PrpC
MSYSWATGTEVGLVRQHNEDSVWPCHDDGSGLTTGKAEGNFIAAVADGMGGHIGGEVASQIAIKTAAQTDGDAATRAHAANLALVDTIRQQPRLAGMGTTLTVAVFSPDNAVEIGNIGDSRAYLYRDRSLSQITRDHSLVAEMMEAGDLTPEDAAIHPYRSVITRALGLDRDIDVDLFRLDLYEGDRILLCTDGLTTMVEDDDIGQILDSHPNPAEAVSALVEAANAAGGADNTSVVLVDLST